MRQNGSMVRRRAQGGTLVLGGGFAGAYVARLLGERGCTIVSPQNSMLYTPLLPEAASGTLEPRHVVVPLRQMCPHAEVVIGRATTLDIDERAVSAETLAGPAEISYERLVVALGAVTRIFPVPGLVEHGRGFKDLADAIALRNHVLQRLDAAAAGGPASELGFVFVGAGYAGVEALAELHDLVQSALRYYPSLEHTPQRWVLVDAAPTILPDIPSRLGVYASRNLKERGIEIHVGETLASFDGEAAVLSGGARVPAQTLVWTTGVKASPLLGSFGLPLDDRGRVRVDGTLRVAGREDIWALGDCAAVPNTRTPGRTDPPTCQHALRQARCLARNLTGAPEPYGYRMLGQVATLGRFKGIADVLGVHLSGFPGWFVARSYHLYALPLLSRRLRVVTDWTTALFFPRDIAELSSLGHPEGFEE
jgi:NADH:quinone reductase (non-electrogenic)